VGKCENRFEEIGHVARRLLARFQIASHGDAAFRASLELGCGLCAPRDMTAARLRGEDPGVEIDPAMTVACGRRPRIEMRGALESKPWLALG